MAAPNLPKVVTIGEIVVEIMADTVGNAFCEPIALRGPFPSGAPAIFIDQAAKLDHPCGMVSCVGDDDFGRINLDRLRHDGGDVSAIRVHPEQVTGIAVVRCRANGNRDFVIDIRNSACRHTTVDDTGEALLAGCGHLHAMGSSLFSPPIIAAALGAADAVKARGGTVSFDPNAREEMLRIPETRDALHAMLARTDIFMPSGPELFIFTEAEDGNAAIAEMIRRGIGCIVVKRGGEGASYHDRDGDVRMPALAVAEVDPTGAGDCFGGSSVTCRLQGRSVADSLRYANASGARAVGVRGPMGGTSSFAELDAFMAHHEGTRA